MPRSFLICKISKNVKELRLDSNVQMILEDNETKLALTEGEPNNYINKPTPISLGKKKIYSYDVHHELKIKKRGIVFNQPFNYYMSPSDFKLFYDKRRKLILVNANKDIALDFIENLDKYNPSLDIDILDLNLHKLTTKINSIKGAWLKVKRKNVSSEAYYGNNVKDDNKVREHLKNGEVTYITFYYPYESNEYYIGIQKNGGIVTYSDNLSSVENLSLIYDVYDRLLK